MSITERLAGLSPREEPPERFREREPFLDGRPAELVAATDGAGIVVGVLLAIPLIVVGRPAFLVVVLGVGYATATLGRGGILAVANARRSRALGTAPTVVSRAVLRLRIAPTAEGAASFAAETDGKLGDRLAEHVRRAEGTPRSGLNAFATAWREAFPALHRSVTLVEAAANAPDGERKRTLDRAMEAILDGTRERATDAADALQAPTTAVYAFGVLLPLSLVGMVPAVGAAGIEATLPAVVVVYDLLLPVTLIGAGGWLLSRRPVAFPPTRIDPGHKPDYRRPSVGVGAGAAVGGWLVAGVVFPPWTRPLAAIGFGVGTALTVYYRPIVRVRWRADELDSALPDALYLVGRRVSDGIAVERAVDDAADELDGVAHEVFESAARRQRQLRIGVESAFTGEYGALEGIPSQRAESAAELLGIAARAGAPAGTALVETADHLEDLRRVERAARRDLGRVTSTLGNTAAFFGPLVGGTTVALAETVGTTDAFGGSAPDSAGLGLAIGVYVLVLAVILTALATGLSRGFDRATVGYRVGLATCAATATYLVAFHAAVTLAGGL